MTPPPIRYPLPSLVLLLILSVLIWRGGDAIQSIRVGLSERWARLHQQPPVTIPASTEPLILAGAIHERLLTLEDDTPYTFEPGGNVLGTIRHRSFVDFYNSWPLQGSATHIRVGNRRPLGWVNLERLLLWPTRIVLMSAGTKLSYVNEKGERLAIGPDPVPVLVQNPKDVQVLTWGEAGAWHVGGRLASLLPNDIPDEAWGLWLTRSELLYLLGRDRSQTPPPGFQRPVAVLKALLGLPINDRPFSKDESEMALTLLGRTATLAATTDKLDALARCNEEWKPDAIWGRRRVSGDTTH